MFYFLSNSCYDHYQHFLYFTRAYKSLIKQNNNNIIIQKIHYIQRIMKLYLCLDITQDRFCRKQHVRTKSASRIQHVQAMHS